MALLARSGFGQHDHQVVGLHRSHQIRSTQHRHGDKGSLFNDAPPPISGLHRFGHAPHVDSVSPCGYELPQTPRLGQVPAAASWTPMVATRRSPQRNQIQRLPSRPSRGLPRSLSPVAEQRLRSVQIRPLAPEVLRSAAASASALPRPQEVSRDWERQDEWRRPDEETSDGADQEVCISVVAADSYAPDPLSATFGQNEAIPLLSPPPQHASVGRAAMRVAAAQAMTAQGKESSPATSPASGLVRQGQAPTNSFSKSWTRDSPQSPQGSGLNPRRFKTASPHQSFVRPKALETGVRSTSSWQAPCRPRSPVNISLRPGSFAGASSQSQNDSGSQWLAVHAQSLGGSLAVSSASAVTAEAESGGLGASAPIHWASPSLGNRAVPDVASANTEPSASAVTADFGCASAITEGTASVITAEPDAASAYTLKSDSGSGRTASVATVSIATASEFGSDGDLRKQGSDTELGQATALRIPVKYVDRLGDLTAIKRDTGCEILLSKPKSASADWDLMLMGTADARQKAQQVIEQIFRTPPAQEKVPKASQPPRKDSVGEGKRVVTCGVLVVAGEHMELLTDLDRIREETGCNLDVRRVSPSSSEFEILLYGSPHVRETARVAIELALQCAVEKQFLSKSKGRVGDSVHQAVNEGPRGG